MLAAHFIAYILLLHGWYAVPQQSIAANPSALGECYTNKIGGKDNGILMIANGVTFAECEAKHGMWRYDGAEQSIPLSKCWGAADGLHCLSRECWDKPGNSNHEKNEACLKDWRAEFAEPQLACHYAYMQPVDAQGNPDGEQVAVRICEEGK